MLRLPPRHRNCVRSQFGGSPFATVDPFWMLLVMHQLGNDYQAWDKASSIDFVAPSCEDVYADFKLEQAIVDELHGAAAGGGAVLHWFETEVKTVAG